MCLSIAIDSPQHVISTGSHKGYQWITVHNMMGYRCGYVRLPKGHPWHSKDYCDVDREVNVHGGLTFGEADTPCDGEGKDDAWWIGFDCAHSRDLPDDTLPYDKRLPWDSFDKSNKTKATVKDQAYVETECKRLCSQAYHVRMELK
jgi:hypothetical protein